MSLANRQLPKKPLLDLLSWTITSAKAPVSRPIAKWVEEEIVLPNGPFAGEKYRHRNHPASRLWFECLDSRRWNRHAASAPTQNGKTLMCYVLPVLYQLFEQKETVVIGLPDMGMANDKWREDFLPIIEASRFAELLPITGEGSRGGLVKRAVQFRNGSVIRFMTAGGGDKSRAGFTARVIAVTEVDGMDESGNESREADKVRQIEARSRAFGHDKRVYLECTVSIERGRIWQEIKNGTDSKIIRPCPKCEAWVTPEREHLIGWQNARNEAEAADLSSWSCPECAATWSEEERKQVSEFSQVVHRGQEVMPDGTIVGEPIKTDTLGFRWSAIDNPFATASQLGVEEWKGARSKDRENAEKELRQFVWCMPYEPPEIEITPLDAEVVMSRGVGSKRGIVPKDASGVVVGVDTGKRLLHWTAMAVLPNERCTIIEYGKQTVDSDRLGVRRGLVVALTSLRQYIENAWMRTDGECVGPSQVWIDSGYHEHTDAVYEFCELANKGSTSTERYRPTKGYGEGQQRTTRYEAPRAIKSGQLFAGNNYHIDVVKRREQTHNRTLEAVKLVHMNADYWKSKLHERLVIPDGEPNAVTLYEVPDPSHHAEFSEHVAAERQIEKFFPLRGTVITWERISRNNHWFDASYSALCAADFTRTLSTAKPKQRKSLAAFAAEARR